MKQVIGFNTNQGPVCLKCNAEAPQGGLAVFEGVSGGKCFLCQQKLNKIFGILLHSLNAAWVKSEQKPKPIFWGAPTKLSV